MCNLESCKAKVEPFSLFVYCIFFSKTSWIYILKKKKSVLLFLRVPFLFPSVRIGVQSNITAQPNQPAATSTPAASFFE